MLEILAVVLAIVFISAFIAAKSTKNSVPNTPERRYFYSKKDAIMTIAEAEFYKRLASITSGKYIVFPQIHLSALLKNETKGKYWKAAFQRINRTSVDYVLADADTLKAVYVVELDDWSHDSAKRRARDAGVAKMLEEVGIPLVRFRDVRKMSDEDITAKFSEAHQAMYAKEGIVQ